MLSKARPNQAPKKEQAKQLYMKYHSLDRVELIKKFEQELDVTSNCARTYISMAAKELNSSLNKPFKTRNQERDKLKYVKAMELFNSNPTLTRSEMINLFVSKLGMTKLSAATHCSMCAKNYKGPTHLSV